MTKPIPLIIDCDPGQDDALMLFLALNALNLMFVELLRWLGMCRWHALSET